jgi:hypothetical protein
MPPTFASEHGLVVFKCNGSGTSSKQLQLVSPTSGAVLNTLDMPSLPNGMSLVVVCLPARTDFSPDWKYTAFINSSESDGSQHVGIVSLATGATVDLTAESSGSGFTATDNVDSYPTFDQQTGDLWFERGHDPSELFKCTPPYTSCVDTGKVADFTGPIVVANGAVLYTSGSFPAMPNPSGTTVAERGAVTGSNEIIATPATINADATQRTTPPETSLGTTLSPLSFGCFPEAWVSETSLICSGDGYNGGTNLYLLAGAIPGVASLTPTPVLPANTRNNSSVVVAQGGSQFAFASQLGTGETELYTEPLGGGPVAPTEIPDTSGDIAFAWQ